MGRFIIQVIVGGNRMSQDTLIIDTVPTFFRNLNILCFLPNKFI